MIHSHVFLPTSQLLSNVEREALPGFLQDERNVVWLDLHHPTPEEVTLLEPLLGIMHLTLEDVTKQGQRAKIENYDHYLYIVMHAMRLTGEEGQLELPELDLILGSNYLVTVHYEPLDEVLECREVSDRLIPIMSRGADFLFYAVADALVDSYFPVLDDFDDVIDQLENDLVSRGGDDLLGRIFKMKRNVAKARKVIAPQMEVFTQLTNRTQEFIKPEHVLYFRDVHDHLIRGFEVIDSYRDLMTSALDAYLSTVSNRLNTIMKRLTVIATIFMPITFVTGVFGMNFGRAPQVVFDNGSLFWVSLAGMALITAMQLLYFRAARWL